MTFPATYNINYYKGNTHQFNVYPKTSTDLDGDGENDAFPLAGYTVDFRIAERRGELLSTDSDAIAGYAIFAPDRTHIKCAITPLNGAQLDPSKTYVYEVVISKPDTDYDKVFTLLSGNISVQDRVEPIEETTIGSPNPPVSISVTALEADSISLSWSANETGGVPDGYYVYVTPYSASYEDSTVLQQLVDALALATPEEVTTTSATITETTAVSALGLSSVPLEAGTAYVYAVASYNTTGTSSPAGNFDVEAGTVDEVFTDGGS